MPAADYPVTWVRRAIGAGVGPTAGLREARAAGLRIRTQSWYRAWGAVADDLARQPAETTAPLGRKPLPSEVGVWAVRKGGGGHGQYVGVYVRNNATGLVERKPFLRTGALVSRGKAIRDALAFFQGGVDAEDGYDETILGAVYLSTYQMVSMFDEAG